MTLPQPENNSQPLKPRNDLLRQKIVNRMCQRPYFMNSLIKRLVNAVPKYCSNVLYVAKTKKHVLFVDWLITSGFEKNLDECIQFIDQQLEKPIDSTIYKLALMDIKEYLTDILFLLRDLIKEVEYDQSRNA